MEDFKLTKDKTEDFKLTKKEWIDFKNATTSRFIKLEGDFKELKELYEKSDKSTRIGTFYLDPKTGKAIDTSIPIDKKDASK